MCLERVPNFVPSDNTDSGISAGPVAGIVIGCLAVIVLALAAIFVVQRRRQSQSMTGAGGFDNALYSQDSDKVGFSNGTSNGTSNGISNEKLVANGINGIHSES